jgi:hypothetical protein
MLVKWTLLHPLMTMEHLGLIPYWLNDDNPRSAKEQIHDNYAHGGGWDPFKEFRLTEDNCLKYPGAPPLRPVAEARLRDELILFYDHSWVAVIQPDGSFEAARID